PVGQVQVTHVDKGHIGQAGVQAGAVLLQAVRRLADAGGTEAGAAPVRDRGVEGRAEQRHRARRRLAVAGRQELHRAGPPGPPLSSPPPEPPASSPASSPAPGRNRSTYASRRWGAPSGSSSSTNGGSTKAAACTSGA